MTCALSNEPLSSTSICLRWSVQAQLFVTHLNLLIRSNTSSCLNSGYFLLSLRACMVIIVRLNSVVNEVDVQQWSI
jgi:hypothetical protein